MYRWLVGNLRLRSIMQTSVACPMDGENGYDEQGTTNREIVAIHLDIGIFVYILSSRRMLWHRFKFVNARMICMKP